MSEKLVPLFLAFLDLIIRGRASPAALERALGVEQWFCLLNRPMFSIFDCIYEFVKEADRTKVATVPAKVQLEITVAMFLMPLLGADLGRLFCRSSQHLMRRLRLDLAFVICTVTRRWPKRWAL